MVFTYRFYQQQPQLYDGYHGKYNDEIKTEQNCLLYAKRISRCER